MDTSVIVFLVEDEDLLCGVLQEALTDGGFAITSETPARKLWPSSTRAARATAR